MNTKIAGLTLSLLTLFAHAAFAESRLTTVLYCRTTSTMELKDLQAELLEGRVLANVKIWSYGYGRGYADFDGGAKASFAPTDVIDGKTLFMNQASYNGIDPRGMALWGPVVQFTLGNEERRLILPRGFEKMDATGDKVGFQARLIESGVDSPTDFHGLNCWISPGYLGK